MASTADPATEPTTHPDESARLTPHQRRIVPLILMVTLTSIMGNSLLSPAIPDILAEFGRPDSSTGILVAALPLPGLLIAPVIGVLADRLGRRLLLVPCLVAFGLGGIAAATAPTFGVLIAARVVMGVGGAGLINLGVVLIGDTFTGQQRTAWIGRNSGLLLVALAVFPVISGFITDAFGWRWALAPYSVALLTAVATWRLLDSPFTPTTLTVREQLGGVGAALRDRRIVVTLVGGAVAFSVTFGAFLSVLPNHLDADFGMSARERGLMLGLPAITATLAAFNLRRVRSRVSRTGVLVAAAGLWTVGFTLIGLGSQVWIVAAGVLLYGLADGALIPTLQDTALHLAPDEHRGAVMATWTGTARFGQAGGPMIAGLVLAGAGTSWALLTAVAESVILLVIFGFGPLRRSG